MDDLYKSFNTQNSELTIIKSQLASAQSTIVKLENDLCETKLEIATVCMDKDIDYPEGLYKKLDVLGIWLCSKCRESAASSRYNIMTLSFMFDVYNGNCF